MWKSAVLTHFMMCETATELILDLFINLREIRGVEMLKVMGLGKWEAFHKQRLINIYYAQETRVHAFPEPAGTTSGRQSGILICPDRLISSA